VVVDVGAYSISFLIYHSNIPDYISNSKELIISLTFGGKESSFPPSEDYDGLEQLYLWVKARNFPTPFQDGEIGEEQMDLL
jgi:hypothetical protein